MEPRITEFHMSVSLTHHRKPLVSLCKTLRSRALFRIRPCLSIWLQTLRTSTLAHSLILSVTRIYLFHGAVQAIWAVTARRKDGSKMEMRPSMIYHQPRRHIPTLPLLHHSRRRLAIRSLSYNHCQHILIKQDRTYHYPSSRPDHGRILCVPARQARVGRHDRHVVLC